MLKEKYINLFSSWVGYLAISLLFGTAAFIANLEITDLDLWLHIGTGRFIMQHGYVPNVDVFSNAIAGKPWLNHEWLFQVLVYNLFTLFGPDGLHNLQTFLVVTSLGLLLFFGYHRDRQLVVTVSLLFVFMVFQQRFTIRPDLFSLMFFVIFFYIVDRCLQKPWALWALCLIQLLWVNIHGFFFLGPLLILITIIAEMIKRHIPLPWEWNRVDLLDKVQFRQLFKIFIVVLLACLVNPEFLRGALYPFDIFWNLSGEHQIFFKYIEELQPTITWGSLWQNDRFIHYKVLIVLSAISFVFNRRAVNIRDFFVWVLFLMFSIKAIRNISFFAFVSYLLIIKNLMPLNLMGLIPVRFKNVRVQHITSIILKVCVILWLLNYMQSMVHDGYYDFDRYERKSTFGGVGLRSYPKKAVDFLSEQGVTGNFYNDFNSGSYIIGRLSPQIKVFIDGRTEAYGSAFFENYLQIFRSKDGRAFDAVAEQFNLTGAFLNTATRPASRELLRHLYFSSEWRLVYLDYDGVIFLKNTVQNQFWIKKFEINFDAWDPKVLDLYRLGSVMVYPYQNYNRAQTLEMIDEDAAAWAEAQAALDAHPGFGEVYEVLGDIDVKNQDLENAYKHYRQGVILSLEKKSLRIGMAKVLTDLGHYNDAIKQYQKIIQVWGGDPRARYGMARAQVLNKNFDVAVIFWNQAEGFVKSYLDEDGKDERLDVLKKEATESMIDAYIQIQAWGPARRFLEEVLSSGDVNNTDLDRKRSLIYQKLDQSNDGAELMLLPANLEMERK